MKIFVSAAFAALLVASPAAAARGRAPDTEATRPPPPGDDPFGAHSGEAVTIKGQTVYPADHVLAPDGYVTLLVTTRDAEGGRHARAVGRQAADIGDNGRYYAVNVLEGEAAAKMDELAADGHILFVELDQRMAVPPAPYGIGMVLEDAA